MVDIPPPTLLPHSPSCSDHSTPLTLVLLGHLSTSDGLGPRDYFIFPGHQRNAWCCYRLHSFPYIFQSHIAERGWSQACSLKKQRQRRGMRAAVFVCAWFNSPPAQEPSPLRLLRPHSPVPRLLIWCVLGENTQRNFPEAAWCGMMSLLWWLNGMCACVFLCFKFFCFNFEMINIYW